MLGKHASIRKTELLLTTLALLFGALMLGVSMDSMHMRPDEYLTLTNMEGSFEAAMTRLATLNNQAPLWWINSWVWQQGIGTEEFVGRYNSLLFSMLTLAIVYQLGKSWFGSPRHGQFAIVVLAVNSLFITYALEMRMYALAMLATALSMHLFWGWLRRPTLLRSVAYGISTAVLLYTHYYLAFVVMTQVIYFLVFESRSLSRLLQGVAAAIAGLLAWLPGAIILFGQLRFINFAASGGLNNPTLPTNRETLSELLLMSTSGQLLVYGALLLLSMVFFWRLRAYWLGLAWLILAAGIVLLLNTQLALYNVRYISFLAPAIGLVIGAALAQLPVHWRWLALAGVCGMSLMSFAAQLPDRQPVRHVLRDVLAQAQAGDALFAYEHGTEGLLVYQLDSYLSPELIANRAFTLEEAREARRVWFLSTTSFSEEMRQTFASLEETHRLSFVTGDCSSQWCYLAQLLIAPPMREPVVFGGEIGFYGAEVTQTPDAIDALLWWSAEAIPSQDYSVSLQLLDEAEMLVAQVDQQIQEASDSPPIPTSQMQIGGTYQDSRMLSLADVPAGEYQLRVLVYRWQDGTRLTLADGRDHYPIDTITIP